MSLRIFTAPLPFLHGIELTETQQDQLFELMLARASVEHAKTGETTRAMAELRHLATREYS